MKKFFGILIVLVAIMFSIGLFAQSYWGGKTLSASQVKDKWGDEKYDAKKFKLGSLQDKAKMAYSIMKDKNLIGKTISEITDVFGDPEGFYFIDSYPAYIIQRGKDRTEDTWQLVFKIGDGYKVRDIIMHRNCCER